MVYSDIDYSNYSDKGNFKHDDKKIQELKSSLEKEHNREFTWEEATKAMRDIKILVDVIFNIASEDLRRQDLLKQNSKGFHLDGSATCEICSNVVSGENTWFDKNGLKCITCQKAVNAKIIPASIGQNKESWYSSFELEKYFNIKGADLKRYIKQSFLKDRIVPGEGKKIQLQLFLIKDNKNVLPPKKLLKPKEVKVIRDGEEYYTYAKWYEFIDEKSLKHLSKYRIMECLHETLTKPIDQGGFLFKQINPLFSKK